MSERVGVYNPIFRHTQAKYIGLARTIYIRLIYAIFGREITKYTVVCGAYIRFWPTLQRTLSEDVRPSPDSRLC